MARWYCSVSGALLCCCGVSPEHLPSAVLGNERCARRSVAGKTALLDKIAQMARGGSFRDLGYGVV